MAYSYWYAIVEASGSDLDVAAWGNGLLESPLRLVIEEDLAAVVSDWPKPAMKRSSDAVDPQLVWQHEGVVERIMASRPVLPVRFGTILADDERIQAVLAERQAEMKADLVHVAGCVELGVRVLWDPPAGEPQVAASSLAPEMQTPGARYLQKRAVEEHTRRSVQEQGKALAGELSRALRTKAVDTRQSVLQTERMLLNAAFLVPQNEVAAFLSAVEKLRGEHGQLAFLCSGPWPPYHFVSA